MLQQLLAGVVPEIGAADAKDVGGVVLRRAQVRVVLFEGKESAATGGAAALDDAARERPGLGLGTLALVLGRDVPHARVLPDWLEHGVEASLRASHDDAPAMPAVTAIGHIAAAAPSSSSSRHGAGTGGRSTPIVVLTPAGSGGPSPAGSVPNKGGGWADLDKFYASESEEDDEEEGEEGDEEDEEESEEGEDEQDGERSDEESDRLSMQEKDHGMGAPRTSEEEKDDGEDEDEDSDVEQGTSLSKMTPFR